MPKVNLDYLKGFVSEEELFAKKAFANSPTYAIVASQDTLKANREFLNNLSE